MGREIFVDDHLRQPGKFYCPLIGSPCSRADASFPSPYSRNRSARDQYPVEPMCGAGIICVRGPHRSQTITKECRFAIDYLLALGCSGQLITPDVFTATMQDTDGTKH